MFELYVTCRRKIDRVDRRNARLTATDGETVYAFRFALQAMHSMPPQPSPGFQRSSFLACAIKGLPSAVTRGGGLLDANKLSR